MPIPKITIKTYKDGRQVARFRDVQGLVRTSTGPVNWVKADQVKQLADYGVVLQIAQARAGLGSDGQRMKPLRGGGRAVFVASVNGKARYARKTYADFKSAHGLQPIRDLYGPGKGGHMLDDIRINYLDDRRATIAITRQDSRNKARGNEKRSPWWGWSDDSVRKLTATASQIFQTGTAEFLFTMGLIGASALADAKRLWRKVA